MQAAHSLGQAIQIPAVYRPDYRADWSFGPMAGRSPSMQQLFSQMRHTARHLRVATIEGEAGSGKMLAARALHEFGLGSQSPFAPFSSARFLEPRIVGSRIEFDALPSIRQSAGGTLVLTRIDELSPAHQARLLEFLQWIDHQYITRALDAIPRQILCLSSRALRHMATAGSLRADLANRLTAIRFAIPPLRDRREDIPLLADLFTQRFSATHGKPIRGLGPQTLPHLVRHAWPGNVRELESVICSAALTCQGQWIRPIDLPALNTIPLLQHPPRIAPPEDDPNLDRAILRHIQQVLARVEGNKLRAAKLLGISRSTLYRLLETTNLPTAS